MPSGSTEVSIAVDTPIANTEPRPAHEDDPKASPRTLGPLRPLAKARKYASALAGDDPPA